jgi:hypothetical protein
MASKRNANASSRKSNRAAISAVIALLFLILPLAGYLVVVSDKVLLLGGALLLGLICFSLLRPEAATLVVVFVLYTNLAVIAKTFHGASGLLAGSFSLLLCLPLANYLFVKREKLVIDYVCLLLLLLLAIVTTSSLIMAKDMNIAINWVLGYALEGMMMYFLFINVIKNTKILKRVIWSLLLAGGLLGSLSLYQEVFSSYRTTFGGLAQRSKDIDASTDFHGGVYGQGEFLKKRDKVRGANRSGGPLGKANRYGQIMLVLLPLALFKYWGEKHKFRKYFALLMGVFILCGFLLTYSRGGFLTMMFMIILLVVFRYIRPAQIVISLIVLVSLMAVAAPGYFTRIDTIRGIEGLFNAGADVRADGTTRGRLTEMLAAGLAFLDYPILGVGPGQYTPFYSKHYQSDPDISYRFLGRNRRAHILYFELAAETGILGFGVFMAIAGLVMFRLWQIRRWCAHTRPDLANIATSIWFAMLAYLGTAVFLHLSYQRYYWIVVAIAGATIQIYQNEVRQGNAVESEGDSDAPDPVHSEEQRNMLSPTISGMG